MVESGVAGIECDPRLLAERANGLQRAVQVRSRFDVNRDVITTGLSEGFEVRIARRDHQMGIEDLLRVRAHRLDDIGTVGDVRHEMAVHHVEVDPVGAPLIDGANLLAKLREVGGQDRRCDNERTRHKSLGHERFRKFLRSLREPRVT